MSSLFSLSRLFAVIRKEFIQMARDRLTFAMKAGIPMMQLILFGFAINQDPKHLPTGLVNGDTGPLSRAIVARMQTSEYFHLVEPDLTEHFLRVLRGIMLKGAGWTEVAPEVGKMALFLIASPTAAVLRYRRTLD